MVGRQVVVDAIRKVLARLRASRHQSNLREERDRLYASCAQLAQLFELEDPLDTDNLVALVRWCKTEHDQMMGQLDRSDERIITLEEEQGDLYDQLRAYVDQWATEAATLTGNHKSREDRMYAQACRDHATDLASLLPPTDSK